MAIWNALGSPNLEAGKSNFQARLQKPVVAQCNIGFASDAGQAGIDQVDKKAKTIRNIILSLSGTSRGSTNEIFTIQDLYKMMEPKSTELGSKDVLDFAKYGILVSEWRVVSKNRIEASTAFNGIPLTLIIDLKNRKIGVRFEEISTIPEWLKYRPDSHSHRATFWFTSEAAFKPFEDIELNVIERDFAEAFAKVRAFKVAIDHWFPRWKADPSYIPSFIGNMGMTDMYVDILISKAGLRVLSRYFSNPSYDPTVFRLAYDLKTYEDKMKAKYPTTANVEFRWTGGATGGERWFTFRAHGAEIRGRFRSDGMWPIDLDFTDPNSPRVFQGYALLTEYKPAGSADWYGFVDTDGDVMPDGNGIFVNTGNQIVGIFRALENTGTRVVSANLVQKDLNGDSYVAWEIVTSSDLDYITTEAGKEKKTTAAQVETIYVPVNNVADPDGMVFTPSDAGEYEEHRFSQLGATKRKLQESIDHFEKAGFRFQPVSGTNIISALQRIPWENDPGMTAVAGHYGYKMRVTREGTSFDLYLDGSRLNPTFLCPVQLPGAAGATWLRSPRAADLATMAANFQLGIPGLVSKRFIPPGTPGTSGWAASSMTSTCWTSKVQVNLGDEVLTRASVGFLAGTVTLTRSATMTVDPETGAITTSASFAFTVNVVVNLLDGRIGLGTSLSDVRWTDPAGTRFGKQLREMIDQIAADPGHSYVLVQPAATPMSEVTIEAKQFSTDPTPVLISTISITFNPGYVQRGSLDSGDFTVMLKIGDRIPVKIVEGGTAHGRWTNPAQAQSRLTALADFASRLHQEDLDGSIEVASAVRTSGANIGESMTRRMDVDEIFFLVKIAGSEGWMVRFKSITPGMMAAFAFRPNDGSSNWDELTSPQTFIDLVVQRL